MATKMNTEKMRDKGIGVGYRPSFRDAFLTHGARAAVSWIEVITENHFPNLDGGETRARQTLRRLRTDYPVALHGIGLNLASVDPLDERYLARLRELSDSIEPFLVTDHLCWTGSGAENLFDLLPFPFRKESLELVAARIGRVQDLLRRPIAVENITYYAQPCGDEMREEEFLNELCRRTGCGLLLDVNNIYVNGRNLGTDPREYLRRIDLSRVAEIHLAGHLERRDGLLIDTHGAPVKDEVWELYAHALALAGPVPTMIERDQNIPAWSEMEAELSKLASLRAAAVIPKEGARAKPGAVADARP